MAFLGVIDEVMSILKAEEAVATTASSSTRRLKRRRRYVNLDREAAHFRVRHDYFTNDCVSPLPPLVILPSVISYVMYSFPKYYA
jgi:hypothetical protein